ncbi:MAG: hypothetical protein U0W24_03245 [Bacteroidales bacterium]
MKNLTLIIVILFGITSVTFAQNDTATVKKKDKVKKGFSFGALPVIAYDTDVGFKYGALVNLYDYGDGSRYPEYDHSLYLEWSRTTKGNGINQIIYDSEKLIPNMRVTAEVSYMTEKALNFYGFNGYKTYYNADFENDENEDYISRVFYRYDRKSFRVKGDFLGNIVGKKFRWLAGFAYHGTQISSVDIDKLNKGKDESEKLPDTLGLFDYYKQWGVLPADQFEGGKNGFLRAGFMLDTRNMEANPTKGLWDEVIITFAPKFFGFDNFTSSLLLLHRQYFTIFPDRLSFAYRLSYQTKLSGDIPYYLLPYFTDSKNIRDGFGGAKTIRGILRNRVVGNGVAFGNFELRWKVIKTYIGNQNFYVALSGFADMGRVIDPFSMNLSGVPDNITINNKNYNPQQWFDYQDESLHVGYGGGIRFALNQNFIVAFDYGMAAKKEDGKSGLYINLNWLF